MPQLREGVTLQLQVTKQLCIGSDNDGGHTHRDSTHTHGEIES